MQSLPQYHFPAQAKYGRVIPKNRIYEHARASNKLKQVFVEQVDKLQWQYKLAPETVNIPASEHIKEIQVFDILLKQGTEELDTAILQAIDKSISHPIYFRVFKNNNVKCAMAWKRPHEGDKTKWVTGDYFYSNWLKTPELEQFKQEIPLALNLIALAEDLIKKLINEPAQNSEKLEQRLERIAEIKKLEKQATKLQTRVNKERQFNRKVELHGQLKQIQKNIELLRGEQCG